MLLLNEALLGSLKSSLDLCDRREEIADADKLGRIGGDDQWRGSEASLQALQHSDPFAV
jgi:hypothetical protein